MDNIDPDGFYNHTLTHLTEEQENAAWRLLHNHHMEGTLASSMLGLTDDGVSSRTVEDDMTREEVRHLALTLFAEGRSKAEIVRFIGAKQIKAVA